MGYDSPTGDAVLVGMIGTAIVTNNDLVPFADDCVSPGMVAAVPIGGPFLGWIRRNLVRGKIFLVA